MQQHPESVDDVAPAGNALLRRYVSRSAAATRSSFSVA